MQNLEQITKEGFSFSSTTMQNWVRQRQCCSGSIPFQLQAQGQVMASFSSAAYIWFLFWRNWLSKTFIFLLWRHFLRRKRNSFHRWSVILLLVQLHLIRKEYFSKSELSGLCWCFLLPAFLCTVLKNKFSCNEVWRIFNKVDGHFAEARYGRH